MERKKYLEEINKLLNFLAFEIQQENCLNLTDKSIYCENFFGNLLNNLYDLNLVNANILSSTNDTIDLIDNRNKICIQVTSNTKTSKIIDTISQFKEKKYNKMYSKLLIVVIANKKYTKQFETYTWFSKDNILTIDKIEREIFNIMEIEKIKKIHKIVVDELKLSMPSEFTVYNEVTTIMEIVKYISESEDYYEEEEVEPDPEYKINSRFKNYSSDIKRELIEYTKIYKRLYEQIYGQLKKSQIVKVSNYLRRESVRQLGITNNPIEAINNIVESLKCEFNKKNIQIDECALYYFLYKHVIECNVFPNEV